MSYVPLTDAEQKEMLETIGVSSVADLFGGYLAKGSIEPLLKYEDAINTLSAEEIQDVAKRYFDMTHSTTIILRKAK